MTINSLSIALGEVKVLLKEADILQHENTCRPRSILNSKFSSEFLRVMHSDDYEQIYKVAMSNRDYDFTLKDDSFLQFSAIAPDNNLTKGKIRFAYFPNPRQYQTYDEFVLEYGFDVDEVGEELIEDYSQFISEAKLKDHITPIRYDYDYDGYDILNHPISHLHIGKEENVRIPIAKIITPQAFTLFVIKNMYLCEWKKAILSDVFKSIFINSKNTFSNVEDNCFQDIEQKNLFLC